MDVALVVTSIAGPSAPLAALASAAGDAGMEFIVVGDAASPPDFDLDGCDFYDLARQAALPFELAVVCPTRHYARKNLGYLIAMQQEAEVIVETDDDTVARASFWNGRVRRRRARLAGGSGWVNVYRYFSDAPIWPRGLPLAEARAPVPVLRTATVVDCPIQQGLVDDDPDVDAIYRLLFTLPFRFDRRPPVALAPGAWCPFNSQNTTWWRAAFPLMYLPATCSFRMTDIWRSFVAQKLAWANGWSVLFHQATVRQQRNQHDLQKDFVAEVDGYLENAAICRALDGLAVSPGEDALADNMRRAYELLVDRGWLGAAELPLLDAWLADVGRFAQASPLAVSA